VATEVRDHPSRAGEGRVFRVLLRDSRKAGSVVDSVTSGLHFEATRGNAPLVGGLGLVVEGINVSQDRHAGPLLLGPGRFSSTGATAMFGRGFGAGLLGDDAT
jgi:hypothetical protein